MKVCCQLLLKTLKQRNERTPQGYNKDDVILVPLPVNFNIFRSNVWNTDFNPLRAIVALI